MQKIKKILRKSNTILLFLALSLTIIGVYINVKFEDVTFELLIYSIINHKGTSISAIIEGIIVLIISLILFVIIKKLVYKLFSLIKYRVNIYIQLCNKKIYFRCNKIFLTIILLIISYNLYGIGDYIEVVKESSSIFEEYYVDASDVEITFPSKKRNLIYIYLESMENTGMLEENGGNSDVSLIPNLEALALSNINFSNTDKVGGMISVYGTTYTSASLLAQTSGIPLKVSIGWSNYKNYGESYPGLYNLGDILKSNGYNNYFMMGSDADYGGRRDMFKHGDYEILDYYWAIDEGKIDKDYKVWWGYEDKKLFEYAKEKLLEISKEDTPFNFTMLTVDTHYVDGYQDDSCEQIFSKKYANSIYCSDSKVGEFVNWIKKQDFYENTTIIIVGDHKTFQKMFYRNLGNYKRTVYNTIINSSIEPINEKNRLFTPFDMFPTTLAALGAKIEGNKLGLGTNLFSSEKTLIEVLGEDVLNEELEKKSFYYDNKILKDHYYKMQDELDKEEDNEEV